MVASDIIAINDISYGIFILLFALFAAEIIFAVSLCVVEDFNDSDLEDISDKLNLKNVEALEKFLRNKHKFENRFHCALITVNILMFYPFIKISAFLVDAIFKDINLILLCVVSLLLFSMYLFINYLLFFALPRKVVRHSSEYTKAMFTLFSLKISVVMAPIADLSDIVLRGFFKLIGKNSFNAKEEVTEDDILSMVQESKDMGLIEDDEVAMINNIFKLNDKEAKDIMTNRKNIVAIDANTPLPDAIKMMLEGSNSRYPVYIDNLDHIIGILHLKDALRYQDANKQRSGAIKRYPKLLREARFVLETRKIDDLFKKMKDDKLQMVIVIDEYGQTSGLIAMEDILEEIVGNILDEYDEEETFVEIKDGKSYEIDGLTPLEDLESLLNIKLESEENDIETINGYILNKLGYIPQEGEECEIEAEGYTFKVLSVEKHIIKSVLVTKIVNEITKNSEDENSSKDTENIEKMQQ